MVEKNLKKLVAIFALFLFSYFLLYALTLVTQSLSTIPILNMIFPLGPWDSPMFWLIPIVGFFTIYLLIDYSKIAFSTSFMERKIFPIFYFFVSVFAFYLNLFFYYFMLIPQGKKLLICIWDCTNTAQQLTTAGQIQDYAFLDFWPIFRTDAFFVFILAGILGWVSYHIIKKLEAKKII